MVSYAAKTNTVGSFFKTALFGELRKAQVGREAA